MNLKLWLAAERGRHAALAAHLDLSPGRITQMADDGVPAKYMLIVRDFTGGAVTLEEMVAQRSIDIPDTTESAAKRREKAAASEQAKWQLRMTATKEKARWQAGQFNNEKTESEPIMNVLIPPVNTVAMTSLELGIA